MSKLSRRQFLYLAVGGAVLPAVSSVARGQTYPGKPVRLVVGASPGGSPDILARQVGQWLSERLGQPFIVENRPGAGGNIATEAVINGPADGYTLLVATLANAVNATLYERLNYNFIRDIAPVASISRDGNLAVVHPSFPAKNVPEFIAYAKARPGRISMASPGVGTSPHMVGELFKFMAGIDMVHVPYRSSAPALTDLLGGQGQVYFGPIAATLEHVKSGRLRALAVTSGARSQALPNVPTMSEFLPGYESSAFYGVSAPKNTPAEIVDRLNKEINAGLTDPKMKAQLADLGSSVLVGSPSDFGKLITDETEKWAKVIRAANIKL
jgi:tripartite-type tricarboxylate transporter receptor subunit TctC